MRIEEVSFASVLPVEGYGPGFFRVGGVVREGALLLHGATCTPWGGADDLAPILALEGEIDVLVLGMGKDIAHAPATLRAALEEAGIGVEVMASPTACRTYNVLLSEGRRVALAVLPVS